MIENVTNTPVWVSPVERQRMQGARQEQVASDNRQIHQYMEMLHAYNEDLRDNTRGSIHGLLSTANHNLEVMKTAWMQRESYKTFVDNKNKCLRALLDQVAEAVETVGANDDQAAASAKGDGKRKPGSKGKDNKPKKK